VRLLLFHLIFRILPFLCIIPYFAARIFLVAESFISLVHAPEGVYVNVMWANYIPHFKCTTVYKMTLVLTVVDSCKHDAGGELENMAWPPQAV
jgi:hypothetical protein